MSEVDERPLILAVDDDPGILAALGRILGTKGVGGYRFVGIEHPEEALTFLEEEGPPDVILLDVIMPGMSGYELCSQILAREEWAYVPVVFVTVLGEEEDRARAFAAGAADLVSKPFDVEELLTRVRRYVEAESAWKELPRDGSPAGADADKGTKGPGVGSADSTVRASDSPDAEIRESPSDGDVFDPRAWGRFKDYLRTHLDPDEEQGEALDRAGPEALYALGSDLGLGERLVARFVADFLGVPSTSGIDPVDVKAGVLPPPYCQANLVVPVQSPEGEKGIVLSNPFDWETLETVRKIWLRGRDPTVVVAEPQVIRAFFTYGEGGDPEEVERAAGEAETAKLNADRPVEEAGGSPGSGPEGQIEIMALANELLRRAISERASDMHVEPKGDFAEVRYRVDGELYEARRITDEQSRRLIARFKALGEMDIAEKRKPQDGALEAVIHGRRFKLRLATTTTPHGESLVVRFLEPFSTPPDLESLGASPEQASTLQRFMARSAGLVLVVGPTGAGKSTTIFSLLSEVEGSRRSVITVEDPVEYRIPFANQQQVNEKAGVTFESLLRSAVRQDPDILLLGEIRDLFSAKASLDFSSSGHLTLTTLHSANSTTAIFRLERLGVARGAMADAILGIVAQKLLKRVCERCREIRPIETEERRLLRDFTDAVPETVPEPVGCPACRGTGFRGRVGIFEVLTFDPAVANLVREGASIASIREAVDRRGDVLIAGQAVEKVREHLCTPRQVYDEVLVEEVRRGREADEREGAQRKGSGGKTAASVGTSAGKRRPGASPATPSREAGDGRDEGLEGKGGDGDDRGGTGDAPRILVVEDDPDGRALVTRFLESAGYEVVPTEDGADALMRLGEESFDLVLSDINMPNLDGLKLMEIVAQKGLSAPVVFLSAEESGDTEARCLELGAEDFLRKPVERNVLTLRIGKILERSR